MGNNQINSVCNIFIIDSESKPRLVFMIEGDNVNDSSLYIVQANHENREVNSTWDDYRKFCLQKSFHSRLDENGFKQTHMKRNNHHFGITKHIKQYNPVIYHSSKTDQLEKYPTLNPNEKDIVLQINPRFFGSYCCIFFDNIDVIKKIASEQNQLMVSVHSLPTIYSTISLGVTIGIDDLKIIQTAGHI